MELNKLTHYLKYNNVETEIEEPKGFDNLSFTMERGEYHGISAEFSQETLGFYNDAVPIIDNAYLADIDSSVEYIVRDGQDEVYHGSLDLSTYEKQTAPYTIVNCRVGEIGTQTILNNRVDTEVDLNTQTTLEGENLAHVPTWKGLVVPQKHLSYVNKYVVDKELVITQSLMDTLADYIFMGHLGSGSSTHKYWRCFVFPMKASVSEFGSLNQLQEGIPSQVGQNKEALQQYYISDSDHEERYGANTTAKIDFHFKADMSAHGHSSSIGQFGFSLFASDGFNEIESPIQYFREEGQPRDPDDPASFIISLDLHLTGVLNANSKINFFVNAYYNEPYYHYWLKIVVKKETEIRMQMFDNLPANTFAVDCLPAHDALNTIVEAISKNGTTVRSDYYKHQTSVVNPSLPIDYDELPNGGGALKVLTNGYKMRGLFTTGDTVRNMPLSFKEMIESLNALDHIGWGFSRETDDIWAEPSENGTLYLRVEPYLWFYTRGTIKDRDGLGGIPLVINDANNIKIKFDPQALITTLKLGYKKYKTNDDYNSIDSVHGERTFSSTVTAVSKDEEHLCDFIADNYSIEEARRARTEVDASEEGSYDENIFVLECADDRTRPTDAENWKILSTAFDVEGIERPDEFINAHLSPRRCVQRWAPWLFRLVNNKDLKFTAGTINYKAAFKDTYRAGYTLDAWNYSDTNKHAENEDIVHSATVDSIVSAETMEFEYPLSLFWYKRIKVNPYGTIQVNERKGWIKKMEYQIATGLTKFTLILRKQ